MSSLKLDQEVVLQKPLRKSQSEPQQRSKALQKSLLNWTHMPGKGLCTTPEFPERLQSNTRSCKKQKYVLHNNTE